MPLYTEETERVFVDIEYLTTENAISDPPFAVFGSMYYVGSDGRLYTCRGESTVCSTPPPPPPNLWLINNLINGS